MRVGVQGSHTMATSNADVSDANERNAGIDHTTVVPENFDPETTSCPRCGKLLADHE